MSIDPQMLTIASGVTTAIGLSSTVATLIYLTVRNRKEKALRELLIGQGVVRSRDVIQILKQFKDEGKRLEALKTMLNVSKSEANHILDLVKTRPGIESVLRSSNKANYVLVISISLILAGIAIFALQLRNSPSEGTKSAADPGKQVPSAENKDNVVKVDKGSNSLGSNKEAGHSGGSKPDEKGVVSNGKSNHSEQPTIIIGIDFLKEIDIYAKNSLGWRLLDHIDNEFPSESGPIIDGKPYVMSHDFGLFGYVKTDKIGSLQLWKLGRLLLKCSLFKGDLSMTYFAENISEDLDGCELRFVENGKTLSVKKVSEVDRQVLYWPQL